jgi:hypothetical protein
MQLQKEQRAKEEGNMEGNIEIARGMLADGKPLEEITKYTVLSKGQTESSQTKNS